MSHMSAKTWCCPTISTIFFCFFTFLYCPSVQDILHLPRWMHFDLFGIQFHLLLRGNRFFLAQRDFQAETHLIPLQMKIAGFLQPWRPENNSNWNLVIPRILDAGVSKAMMKRHHSSKHVFKGQKYIESSGLTYAVILVKTCWYYLKLWLFHWRPFLAQAYSYYAWLSVQLPADTVK